jgi:fatty acid-binding protein DegV
VGRRGDGDCTCARAQAFAARSDRAAAQLYGDRPLNVGVLHANALADAEALLAQAREVLHIDEAQFSDIGPAIAALAGPGVVGLAGCPNDL